MARLARIVVPDTPHHVHLILVPADADGIRRALSRIHRTYAGHIHARLRRIGHFWQGRFGCVAMDEEHLAAALRYVALNPVRARLVERATDWRWSSVATQFGLIEDDGVTTTTPVRARFPDFAALLTAGEEEMAFTALRRAESIGLPIGNTDFFDRLEDLTDAILKPARRGRKAKAVAGEN